MRLSSLLLAPAACAPLPLLAQSVEFGGFTVSAQTQGSAVSLRWHYNTVCGTPPQPTAVVQAPGGLQADFCISDACSVVDPPPPDLITPLGNLPPGLHTIQVRGCSEGANGQVCTLLAPFALMIGAAAAPTELPALDHSALLLLMGLLTGIVAWRPVRH